jgi:hypothetical protein
MRSWSLVASALAVSALGCGLLGGKPTAMSVCKKLEEAKVASGCKEDKPGGLGATAVEKAVFDLPSVPGKTGQVLRFEKAEHYKQTEDGYSKAALLAGPHRYGNEGKLIYLQMNEGASLDVGKKVKAIVAEL